MKTKGALIWEFNQPWSIEEIEIGDPKPGEVKVQMEASGMCHSDHHLVTGGIPMLGFPVLGGHEGAGIVLEVGAGVEGVAPGDHVVMSFIPSCGKCPSCQAGLRNLCDLGAGLLGGVAIADGTHRITAKGEPVFPMTLLGTFSPYMVVHESSVVKIDPSIPFEVACLVGCGVTTGYGSATHTAQIKPGEDVAVVGVGGVGMSAVQGAVISGARNIFVIEPVEWKRDAALKFGATHAYPDMDAAMMGVAEVTQGFMAKKVIVTVGEVNGADVDSYMNLTSKSGTCVMTAIGSMLDTNSGSRSTGTISLPSGIRETGINFRLARARGIPMIVIAIATAVMTWPIASHTPQSSTQMMFPTSAPGRGPGFSMMVRPKGHRA